MTGGKKDSFSARMRPSASGFTASGRNHFVFARLEIQRKDLVKGVMTKIITHEANVVLNCSNNNNYNKEDYPTGASTDTRIHRVEQLLEKKAQLIGGVTMNKEMLVAYDFLASETNDLTILTGQRVEVLDESDADWWWVQCKVSEFNLLHYTRFTFSISNNWLIFQITQ